jgi:hypothetical protein
VTPLETLRYVIGVLDAHGIEYMITGSVASSLQGGPRTTHGIDVVVDVVIVYGHRLVMFEFKRPAGAPLPPVEISGQVAYGQEIERRYGLKWSLIVVPGPEAKGVPTPQQIAEHAHAGSAAAEAKWGLDPVIGMRLLHSSREELAERIASVSWEQLIELLEAAVSAVVDSGWNRNRALEGLDEFRKSRVSLGFWRSGSSKTAGFNGKLLTVAAAPPAAACP